MSVPERPHAPPDIEAGPCREPDTMLLVLRGVVTPEDLPGLARAAVELIDGNDATRIVCDVGLLTNPDAATVDALARLRLAARRRDREVRLLHASRELEKLLELVGLDEVIAPCRDLLEREEGLSGRD